MAESIYRRLQRAILADDACAPHVHTNEMPRLTSARDKDQAIADILNARGVVGLTRRAEAADVHRALILTGEWPDVAPGLRHLIDAELAADYYAEAGHLLSGLSDEARAAVLALCRAPITWQLVSRAVRGPWED